MIKYLLRLYLFICLFYLSSVGLERERETESVEGERVIKEKEREGDRNVSKKEEEREREKLGTWRRH